ncbi:MAG: hypothetical protein AAB701_02815 [Patescibacteria group bacterium]
MDLDLYAQLFRKHWMVFCLIVAGSIGLVWGISVMKAPAFEGSLLLSFNAKPEAFAQTQYQYGEFYGLQGSEFLAKYFAADLADPATVETILTRAHLGVPNKSLTSLGRIFTLKPVGIAALSARFESGTEDDTLRGLQSLQDVAVSHLTALQQKGLYPNIVLTTGQIYVRQQTVDVPITLGIGAVAGLVLGFFVLLLLSLAIPQKKA